jgi:hypothetical protein
MGTKLKLGLIVGLLLAVAGVAAAAASSSSTAPRSGSDDRKSVVLRLVATEVDSTFIDLGDPDFSQGDQFVFTNDLLRRGEKVGEDGGMCVVTRLTAAGAATFKCVGSNALPGGQITVQGLVTYGPGEEVKEEPYFFAITGGTGRYKTARGQVKIEETSGDDRLTFRIIL